MWVQRQIARFNKNTVGISAEPIRRGSCFNHRIFGPCRRVLLLTLMILVLLAQGCASAPPRKNPLPQELYTQSQIPNIPNARYWGDTKPPYADRLMRASPEQLRKRFPAVYGGEWTMLAISGGGSNGAFGAGVMNGWTAAGNRPEFTIVTGISTGALLAPFVYLGSAYDETIKDMYTSYSTADLVKKRSMTNTIKNDAAADTARLRAMIAKYITKDVMQAMAAEFRRGRLLLIGTTNMDAERPVTWNIGLIAASGAPNALDLIRDVMLASASIPVAFPPVIIQVEANGQIYDEMHMDGGTARQSFLFSFGIDNREIARRLQLKGQPRVYVLRNAKLAPIWETVDRKIFAIAGRAAASMIRTQGIGDLYREWAGAQQWGFDYNLGYIPADFDAESNELFDPVYMGKLFQHGYRLARTGFPWQKTPPGIKAK